MLSYGSASEGGGGGAAHTEKKRDTAKDQAVSGRSTAGTEVAQQKLRSDFQTAAATTYSRTVLSH